MFKLLLIISGMMIEILSFLFHELTKRDRCNVSYKPGRDYMVRSLIFVIIRLIFIIICLSSEFKTSNVTRWAIIIIIIIKKCLRMPIISYVN